MPDSTSIPIGAIANNSPFDNWYRLCEKKKSTILTSEEDAFNESLLDILENGNDEDFLIKYSKMDSLKKYNDIHIKLFKKAIVMESSEDVVEKILINITDINYIKDLGNERTYNATIIEDVCLAGNLEAFRKLLSLEHLKLPTPMNILHIMISSLDENLFNRWFNILRAFGEFDLNEENGNHQTPLDIAYCIGKTTVIRKLLEAGIYIGTGNYFEHSNSVDKCALDPKVIMECFDGCIDGELTDRCCQRYIKFDYKNLVPPKSHPYLNEMTPIMHIINSKEHLDLLKHPLITSFMALKWEQMSKYFYINFLLYCFYLISIVSYIILTIEEKTVNGTTGENTESGTTGTNIESAFTNLTWWLTIFGTGYLIIREAIQLIHPKEYLKKSSNYLELLLIIFSILIITHKSLEKEIVVYGILLIALEFWILVGNLPILSFSTHMLMLEEVLKTFLISFSFYAIFIFTFALCFFILFGPEKMFGNIFQSVVKTMAMVSGELNFSELGLESVCSYILILLFIICMTVVLMNLLNGLAVSDIQAIRQQVEFNGLICRAKLLNNHDFKLFHDGNKNKENDNLLCNCQYNVSGVYLNDKVYSNKIIIPHKCLLCYINGDNGHTNTKQWTWFGLFAKEHVWQTFDLCMGNRTVMESSIVEAKTFIRNRESAICNEQNQLNEIVENIENKTENLETNVLDIYKKSLTTEQIVQNMEQNIQNIEVQVQNIEKKVENIGKEQQNIGKNVEKILKSMQ